MLRLSLVAAVLAALFAVPAHAEPTVLMPGVTYDRQLVLSRFGPEVVHVVTAPRPGGLWSVAPVLSNGTLLGKETLTSMQKRLATTGTMVGIDGDTSSADGVPSGVLIQSGALGATTNVKRSSIGFDAAGTMRVERVGLNATWQGTGQRRAVVVNRRPGAQGATLYTPAFGSTTPAESGSVEAVLPALGTIVPGGVHTAPVAELRSGGLTPIPAGGGVLVARGTTAQRLTEEAAVGTAVTFRLVMNPDWSAVVNGLAGGPLLVRDGKAIFNAHEDFSAAVLAGRSARAAIGQRADGAVVLVVVDGGLPGYSVGVTNFELAQTLARQGVVVGAALEGGKAAGLAFDGKLLSRTTAAEQPVSEMLAVTYAGVYAPPLASAQLSPNGDGVDETQSFKYRVARQSTVTVSLVDPVGTTRAVETAQPRAPGIYTDTWTGLKPDLTVDLQGTWHWLVTAKDDLGRDSTADRPFVLNTTLGALRVTPSTVAVTATGGALTVGFTLALPASWTVTIQSKAGATLRTYTGRSAQPGPVSLRWDGRSKAGVRAYPGSYVAKVTATNDLGATGLTAPFAVVRR
jgi:hypothetical protein